MMFYYKIVYTNFGKSCMIITKDTSKILKDYFNGLGSGATLQVCNKLNNEWHDFSFYYDSCLNKFIFEYNSLMALLKQGYTTLNGRSLAEICSSPDWWLISEIIDKYDCEISWKNFKAYLAKENWRIKELC